MLHQQISADLEFSLRRWSGDDYAVEARFRLAASATEAQLISGAPPRVRIDFDALLEQALDAEAYGAALSRALFADPRVAEAFVRARTQAETAGVPLRLRLRLDADDDDLHALRWETLHAPDGSGPLARSERILLSRHLDSADMTPLSLGPRGALRALIVVASPEGLTSYGLAPLDVPAELDRARAALADLPVTVVASGQGDGATLDALLAALREGPQILYLVAHGTLRRGRPYLWLDNERGEVERIEGVELVEAIARLPRRPLLAVLGSCQSAGSAHAGVLAALGPQLAEAGVAAVLAMQGDLAIESAARLLPAFFRELWRDGQVDRALAAARLTMRASGDWWQPALFMRVRDGRLWLDDRPGPAPAAAPAIPPPPEPERPPALDGFVGRAAELEAFGAALDRMGLVALTGMPGVGKTSMAAALARRAGDPASTFWHTFQAGEGVETLIWSLAGFLAHAGQPGLWELLQQARLGGGQLPPPKVLVDYLVQMLGEGDYLLCLDDFHHADDDPQLEHLVEHLPRLLRERKLRLIIASRRVPNLAAIETIEVLTGLNPTDATALLRSRGLELPAEIADQLYAQTTGNAQLLALAATALRRTQDWTRLLADLTEADNIERYLLDQIDRDLGEDERATMRPVAVLLDRGGTRSAIEAVAGGASVRRPLRSLSDRHLLLHQETAAGREYRQHAIVQHFYYQELARRERAELHRRAAAYYEHEAPDPLRAALHLLRAGEHNRAAAIAVAEQAALVNAGQAGLLLALLVMFEAGPLTADAWIAICLARGEVATLLRRRDEAEAGFRAALEALDEQPAMPAAWALRARACRGMAELLEYEDPQVAQVWVERAASALGTTTGQEAAALAVRQGSIAIALGRLDEAEDALARAVALTGPDELNRALALNNLGIVACMQGAYGAGREHFAAALHIHQRLGSPWSMVDVLHNLGMADYVAGDWSAAEEHYLQALELAKQLGLTANLVALSLNLGMLALRRGEYEKALGLLTDCIELARANRLTEYLTGGLLSLADLRLRGAQLAEADAALAEAASLAQAIASLSDQVEAECLRAELALRRGEPQLALEHASAGVGLAREHELTTELGNALRALGLALLAGRPEEAWAALAESADLLADEPYELARTHAAWGAALRQSDPARAAELLRAAEVTFLRLGAQHDLLALRQLEPPVT